VEVIYHGHSCIQLRTSSGQSLVIDPFLRGNELAVVSAEDIHTDYVLLTHAHNDHIADAEAIARSNNAPIVATFELANYMSWKGLQTLEMNIGGTVDLGFAKVTMIQAFHSSGIVLPEEQRIIYAGMPAGFIVRAEGKTVLHAGDTCLFGDMKLIGERFNIDLAFLPIGDRFTMGPEDALQAAQWFGAKQVVPVHYDTFAAIQQDAEQFVSALADKGIEGKALRPGDQLAL